MIKRLCLTFYKSDESCQESEKAVCLNLLDLD